MRASRAWRRAGQEASLAGRGLVNESCGRGRPHAAAAHIELLRDCAEICRTSADFLLRASKNHSITCGACAVVCEACADDCAAFNDDDDMRRCADTCRRCAASCRSMAS